MTASKRIEYVDIAKGIAIMLVVMGHVLQFDMAGANRNVVFSFIYSFHMPLFMSLSGYVVGIGYPQKKRGYRETLIRRFNQLAVPYFVWGLIIMPIFGAYHTWEQWSLHAQHVFLNPGGSAWFLITLFGIHVEFIFSLGVISKFNIKNPVLRNFIQFAVYLSIPTVCRLTSGKIAEAIGWGGITAYFHLGYSVMFYIGYLFKRNEQLCFNNFAFLGSCLVFGLTAPFYVFNITPFWYKLITTIPATIMLINIAKGVAENIGESRGKFYNCILNFGKNSIMIYLMHFLFVTFTVKAIDVSAIPAIPLFMLTVPIAFLIGYICVIVGKIVSGNKMVGRLLFGKY